MSDLQFVPDDSLDDRDKLLHFLNTAEAFFGQLVQDGEDHFGPALLPLVQPAWEDVAPQFNEVRRNVESEWGDKLHDAGLAGTQLAFKLGVVGRLHGAYESDGSVKSLARLLEGTANVLDSVVVATRTGEALKEFQQALRLALYDAGN